MGATNWHLPEHEVISEVGKLVERGQRGVLATIVRVEGSAYRRPGAKMLVPEDGDLVGHITADCLEDEVRNLASDVLAAGEPRVETYDLQRQADDVWGLGVGCNGVIDVFLEPVGAVHQHAAQILGSGHDVAVVTVVEAPDTGSVGPQTCYDGTTDEFASLKGFPSRLGDRLGRVVPAVSERGRSTTVDVGGWTVFVDCTASPDDLVILGSGHDIEPLTEFGKQAGFSVTVLGFRGANATPERFPAADAVRSTSPARVREAATFDADTYVVVATHNFVDDRIVVDEALHTEVPYVGLMGPRKRFAEMREAFRDEGRTFSEAELSRLYTPVGLDLGADTPDQVALSVVAEVLAVRNGRGAGHLSNHEGPIHDRVELPPEGVR